MHQAVCYFCVSDKSLKNVCNIFSTNKWVLIAFVLNEFKAKLIGQQNKNSKHSSVYGEK
jgi:hypothetical protein